MKLTVLSSLALAAPAAAQVVSTVGPEVAPLGSPITITISNDGAVPVYSGLCPFFVDDGSEDGVPVFAPVCVKVAQEIAPGETLTAIWDQTDAHGMQVSTGLYYVVVQLPDGSEEVTPIVIDAGADAAISILGTPATGATRELLLSAPQQPNLPYRLAASFAGEAPTLASCAGTIPLAADALLALTLPAGGGILLNSTGLLSSTGLGFDAKLALPDEPVLAGVAIRLGFVVVDNSLACSLAAVSEPLELTLL